MKRQSKKKSSKTEAINWQALPKMWKLQQVVADNNTAGNATTDTDTDTDDDADDDTDIMESETTPATTDRWWRWTILLLLLLLILILILLLILPPTIEGNEVFKIIHHHRNSPSILSTRLVSFRYESTQLDLTRVILVCIERFIFYVPYHIVPISIRIMIRYDIVL